MMMYVIYFFTKDEDIFSSPGSSNTFLVLGYIRDLKKKKLFCKPIKY